jgi:hypothetical protein
MPIVAYHNSWPYFARRFRWTSSALSRSKPGVPPSPSHLAGIVRPCARARPHRRARAARAERDVAFVASKAGAVV